MLVNQRPLDLIMLLMNPNSWSMYGCVLSYATPRFPIVLTKMLFHFIVLKCIILDLSHEILGQKVMIASLI